MIYFFQVSNIQVTNEGICIIAKSIKYRLKNLTVDILVKCWDFIKFEEVDISEAVVSAPLWLKL